MNAKRSPGIFLLVNVLLHSPCGCLSVSYTVRHFRLLPGLRVSGRGTEVNRFSDAGLTLIRCTTLCFQDCGVFHFDNINKLCVIFAEKPHLLEVSPHADWSFGYNRISK
ncbi:hypothetical protein ElyMa_002517300 [Elysia marginata]|uniref:Apple domain-containing protein n=1 Tax=Elysia marginata TaxID=1093978 RepID=A0AAV4GVP6_9GAST|nr:hypothetical protein ElyMa_002517300 [Elysia marginata]